MDTCSPRSPDPVPPAHAPLLQGLEEVCAAGPRDMAGALAFVLSRAGRGPGRGVALTVTRAWLAEYGRPHGPGLAGFGRREGVLLVITRTEADCLWAMEQALRSGGLDAVLGGIDSVDLTRTRRLEFAARDGKASGILLRTRTGDLSAARRRWRVSTLSSASDAHDPRAPGRLSLRAELTRSRTERPGVWMLEQDDETHRLRLADRLAGDGPGAVGRPHAA
ncbi:ImuA family protein [Brevundimonas sp. R86498]|uniref:ImuA family protein n=1 Tax=Brevundimonas sp. R86498 TaxID=3093845 RepID=UPI0037C79CFA